MTKIALFSLLAGLAITTCVAKPALADSAIFKGSVSIGTTDPVVSLDMSGRTDAIALPSGTTETRPTGNALIDGDIRYNESTPAVEAYVDGEWVALSNQRTTRIKLSSTTNFYVATTGSDSNPCTAAAKCQTIGHALSFVQSNYDLGGQTVNINVADGTYTAPVSVTAPFVGGIPNLIGNTTTPTNCIVSVNGSHAFSFSGTSINVSGFKITTTTSGSGIYATNGATVTVNGNMNYGAIATAALHAIAGSRIVVTANYSISGNQGYHVAIAPYGYFSASGVAVTLTGTPAFSTAFMFSTDASVAMVGGMTFSGAATGPRFFNATNAVIDTNGGGTNFFPGSVNGTNYTGAQYI